MEKERCIPSDLLDDSDSSEELKEVEDEKESKASLLSTGQQPTLDQETLTTQENPLIQIDYIPAAVVEQLSQDDNRSLSQSTLTNIHFHVPSFLDTSNSPPEMSLPPYFMSGEAAYNPRHSYCHHTPTQNCPQRTETTTVAFPRPLGYPTEQSSAALPRCLQHVPFEKQLPPAMSHSRQFRPQINFPPPKQSTAATFPGEPLPRVPTWRENRRESTQVSVCHFRPIVSPSSPPPSHITSLGQCVLLTSSGISSGAFSNHQPADNNEVSLQTASRPSTTPTRSRDSVVEKKKTNVDAGPKK